MSTRSYTQGFATRFTSWLGAWKYVLILLALLALSVGVNVWQWKRAITAPLRAEVADLQAATATASKLLEDGQKREFQLITAASAAAHLLKSAGADYSAAVAIKPLTSPDCAPGKGRVDAVNKGLGAR